MRTMLRTLPLALIYAVLAGPAEPGNWLAGAVLGLLLALLLRRSGGDRTGAARVAGRALFLPWFLLGACVRVAAGSWTTARILLTARRGAALGFARCRTETSTGDGQSLLALVESLSPDSIVVALDRGGIHTSLVQADKARQHCAGQRRWYRRFQRRMLP